MTQTHAEVVSNRLAPLRLAAVITWLINKYQTKYWRAKPVLNLGYWKLFEICFLVLGIWRYFSSYYSFHQFRYRIDEIIRT